MLVSRFNAGDFYLLGFEWFVEESLGSPDHIVTGEQFTWKEKSPQRENLIFEEGLIKNHLLALNTEKH